MFDFPLYFPGPALLVYHSFLALKLVQLFGELHFCNQCICVHLIDGMVPDAVQVLHARVSKHRNGVRYHEQSVNKRNSIHANPVLDLVIVPEPISFPCMNDMMWHYL